MYAGFDEGRTNHQSTRVWWCLSGKIARDPVRERKAGKITLYTGSFSP